MFIKHYLFLWGVWAVNLPVWHVWQWHSSNCEKPKLEKCVCVCVWEGRRGGERKWKGGEVQCGSREEACTREGEGKRKGERERERERERDGVREQAARLILLLSQHPFCETLFRSGGELHNRQIEEAKGGKIHWGGSISRKITHNQGSLDIHYHLL